MNLKEWNVVLAKPLRGLTGRSNVHIASFFRSRMGWSFCDIQLDLPPDAREGVLCVNGCADQATCRRCRHVFRQLAVPSALLGQGNAAPGQMTLFEVGDWR